MVHTKLQEADHDYNGQRVQALHRVNEALHILGGSAPPNVAAAASLGNLSQGQSDGILRDSIHKLRVVEGHLGSSAPHHHQARIAVGEAIHHLEVALRIR